MPKDYAAWSSPRPRPRWRRRLVQAALGLLALACLMIGLARAVEGSPAASFETVTVAPGDTIWSIAAARYPDADTRQQVSEIERANHLDGPVIQPGQRLRVPAS